MLSLEQKRLSRLFGRCLYFWGGGQMRIIAFITHSADIRHILEHIGVASEPALISPARGPPLWERCDALAGEGSQIGSDWDLAAQPTPDYEVDQRVSW